MKVGHMLLLIYAVFICGPVTKCPCGLLFVFRESFWEAVFTTELQLFKLVQSVLRSQPSRCCMQAEKCLISISTVLFT